MNETRVEEALGEVVAFLEKSSTPYMVIGGLAAIAWGVPRLTRDVDITVLVPAPKLDDFLAIALAKFPTRIDDAAGFARGRRVLLISAANGIPIDLMLALTSFEEEAIARARSVKIGDRVAKVVSPEDLILHKLLAPRAIDSEDMRRVIEQHRESLDRVYLDVRVRELTALMDDPAIAADYQAAWEGRS